MKKAYITGTTSKIYFWIVVINFAFLAMRV